MADQAHVPQVEVAVALVTRGEQVLGVFNRQWMAFTLPMTKRRRWQDPTIPPAQRDEAWIDAAARAAAECLGCTVTELVELPLPPEKTPYHQSDRDGQWKRYTFRVFRVDIDPRHEALPDVVAEWLTRDQFLDENRRPISPTARYILQILGRAGLSP